MSNLAIQYVSPDRLRPYPGNARSHSRKQLKLIENSIKRFGFTNPIPDPGRSCARARGVTRRGIRAL